MYLTHNGEELAFKWHHDTENNTTHCVVTKTSDNSEVAHTMSKVHPNDNYDRAEGRRRTLGRVIQSLYPTSKVDEEITPEEKVAAKAGRLEIWSQYANWKSEEPRMTLGTKKERKAKLKVA